MQVSYDSTAYCRCRFEFWPIFVQLQYWYAPASIIWLKLHIAVLMWILTYFVHVLTEHAKCCHITSSPPMWWWLIMIHPILIDIITFYSFIKIINSLAHRMWKLAYYNFILTIVSQTPINCNCWFTPMSARRHTHPPMRTARTQLS